MKENNLTGRVKYSVSMILNWKKRFRDTALLMTKSEKESTQR